MYICEMEITPDILIEDLVELYPDSVKILREYGLICVICGEPIWGTLDDLAKSKGIDDETIRQMIREIDPGSTT
jgi:methionine synthase II (cobalamin-independent)